MKGSFDKKETRTLSIAIFVCGVLFIGSGLIMCIVPGSETIVRKNFSLDVTEGKVQQAQTNEIKLKDMELEINNPISLNVKDYIENVAQIEESVLKSLKLDTSLVNINQAGSYNYTITYKRKKYTALFIIKEKELPKLDLTLKNLSLEKGAALSTNISTYVADILSDEVKNSIVLNLSEVNTAQPGEYQYTILYNGKLFTAKIFIYEKQPTVITPNTPSPTPTPSPSPTPEQ